MYKYIFLLGLITNISVNSSAQIKHIPYLEREVNVVAQNKSIEDLLSDISHQGGFVFSYSPEALQSSNKVSVSIQRKTVRVALNEIFNDQIDYKIKGKYVILKKPAQPKATKEETIRLEGYVYDARGNRLTEASIYDKGLMVSAVTDEYGYFSVDVPVNKPVTALKVSKLGFSDTALVANTERRLKSVQVSISDQDSMHVTKWKSFINLDKITPKWLIPKKTKINALNINDSIFKAVQVSLMPYVTTNHFLGGNVVNDFSLNMTVGYIQGVRILELGGIINIVRDNASFVQLGGIGNMVGGKFTGFQGGGIFNYASEIKGVQASGIVNLAGDADVQLAGTINRAINNDVQISGYANWAKQSNVQITGIVNKASVNFLQIAGVLNWTNETNMQIAGVFNKGGRVDNMQIAGVINQAKDVKALQVAGVVNSSSNDARVQVAGCVNTALGTTEIQVSPLVNIAGKVNKLQLALINVSDSCVGVPVGLFSFVRNGYHKLDFSVNELFFFNTSFRTGVRRFYTFINAGINPLRFSSPVWTYGYGLGTSFGGNEKYQFDLDLSHNLIIYKGKFADRSKLYSVYFGMDRKVSKKMTLAFGLSYNVMFSDSESADYKEVYSKLQPYTLRNSTRDNGTNLKTWIGAKLAVRFF